MSLYVSIYLDDFEIDEEIIGQYKRRMIDALITATGAEKAYRHICWEYAWSKCGDLQGKDVVMEFKGGKQIVKLESLSKTGNKTIIVRHKTKRKTYYKQTTRYDWHYADIIKRLVPATATNGKAEKIV